MCKGPEAREDIQHSEHKKASVAGVHGETSGGR